MIGRREFVGTLAGDVLAAVLPAVVFVPGAAGPSGSEALSGNRAPIDH